VASIEADDSVEKAIFLTTDEHYSNAFVVDTALQTDYEIVTVPTSIKEGYLVW
jgi:hypothetical protein